MKTSRSPSLSLDSADASRLSEANNTTRTSPSTQSAWRRAIGRIIKSNSNGNLRPIASNHSPRIKLSSIPRIVLGRINVFNRQFRSSEVNAGGTGSGSDINLQSPFEIVITTLKGNERASGDSVNITKILPQLNQAIHQKQGLVLLGTPGCKDQGEILLAHLKNQGGMDIDPNNRLIGAYSIRETQENMLHPLWMLQVYDRGLGMTIDVPMTQITLENLETNRPYYEGGDFVRQFDNIRESMDSHLLHIHPLFQDSPTQPAILCPENPRLSQLVCATEEIISRQARGEMAYKSRADYLEEIGEVLRSLSDFRSNPGGSAYFGEEACRVEDYLAQSLYTIDPPRVIHPKSIGHLGDVSWEQLNSQLNVHPARIRALKRHAPLGEPPSTSSSPSPISMPQTRVQSQVAQTSDRTLRTEPDNNPGLELHPPGLSLNPLRPTTLPAHRLNQMAYKESAKQMQCGVQAINGFLQTPALNSINTTAYMIRALEGQMVAMGIDMSQLKGLGHPAIITAMKDGRPIRISKSDFLGHAPHEISVFNDQSAMAEWTQIINLRNPDKSWVSDGPELSRIESVDITPSDWLSCQRGINAEDTCNILNQLLENKPAHWDHLANQVQLEPIGHPGRSALQVAYEIENQRQQFPLQDKPIIVMRGAAGTGNHFFAVVPDAQGNWLSMNANGTTRDGIQPCEIWARAGQLGRKLDDDNISHIIY